MPVASNLLRKLWAEQVNGQDAHKKLCVGAASLFLLFLAFLPPLPSTFIFTSSPGNAKESAGAGVLKLIRSGQISSIRQNPPPVGLHVSCQMV